jgi:hypothetical protein
MGMIRSRRNRGKAKPRLAAQFNLPANIGLAGTGMAATATMPRKSPRHYEHLLQTAVVRNMTVSCSETEAVFVAIPNGEARDEAAGARLKEEGARAGALDGFLLLPRARIVFVEFKLEKNEVYGIEKTYLRKTQREFVAILRRFAHDWVVIRSQEEWVALLDREGVSHRIVPVVSLGRAAGPVVLRQE